MTAIRINPGDGIKAKTVSVGTLTTNSSGYASIPASVLPFARGKCIAAVLHHWSTTSPASAISVALGTNTTIGGYLSAGANVTVTNLQVTYFYRE